MSRTILSGIWAHWLSSDNGYATLKPKEETIIRSALDVTNQDKIANTIQTIGKSNRWQYWSMLWTSRTMCLTGSWTKKKGNLQDNLWVNNLNKRNNCSNPQLTSSSVSNSWHNKNLSSTSFHLGRKWNFIQFVELFKNKNKTKRKEQWSKTMPSALGIRELSPTSLLTKLASS